MRMTCIFQRRGVACPYVHKGRILAMFIWKSLQPSLIAKVITSFIPVKDQPASPAAKIAPVGK